MTDLHELLERTTDAVEPPGLAARALVEARRRRTRSRGVGAALVATAAVLVLVVSVRVVTGDPRSEEPPADPATPTVTEAATAPPIPPSRVQDVWDPRGVEALPVVDLGVPRVLPVAVSGPVEVAVALLDGPSQTLLVGIDGAQTDLALPAGLGDGRTVALSPDGTRVAAVGVSGLFWRAVDGGSWRRIEVPRTVTGEWIKVEWVTDGSAVVLWQLETGVRVVLASGELQPVAPVDPLGGAEVGPLENLQRPVLGPDAVLAARADINGGRGARPGVERDGLLAFARDTLATRGFVPLLDDRGYYVDGGGLTPLAWLRDRAAVVRVLPKGAAKEYLVAWDVDTGELSRLACWPREYDATFATDLLVRR